ncbi:MAG TPA: XdhC/CoxI family protein [Gaiellaceae bacterium]|nr:XdhC/CoxI family protein [Gaiellaceae bacterium]
MRDILPTLVRWRTEGRRVAIATVVEVRGSAPRDPGATLALNDLGEIAGSVTGGCVEPSVILEAQAVLDGGGARVREYGIADDEAFDVGLSCGGTVAILIAALDTSVLPDLDEAVRADRPIALSMTATGVSIGAQAVREGGHAAVTDLLARGESTLVDIDGETVFLHCFAPRPAMIVFGAIDHAAALARVGKLLGYRVTVCDARAAFVTAERFPEADELVVEWPDRFLERTSVDETAAICVLTHDQKFDVPALIAALETAAVYIGAMGSKVTTAEREERLRAAGVGDAGIARIHAPIGLAIGARSPEEVAVAIGAEIVEATALARRRAAAGRRPVSVLAQ